MLNVLGSLNPSLFSDLILVGDFNVNLLSHSTLCTHLTHLMSAFSLTQVVDEPTHVRPNGTSSLIDLALMSAPHTLIECTTVPPLLSSDNTTQYHLGVSMQVKYPSSNSQPLQKRRVIWRYHLADFHKASQYLRNLNIEAMFADADVDTCWLRWKQAFHATMDACIPKSTLPDKKSAPWMTKEIVQAIRKRNYFYRKARRTRDDNLFSRYKQLRSVVTSPV